MRLFLALELPRDVRDELERLQRGLRRDWQDWRWVRPAGIHLTLRFLGEVGRATDRDARAGWAASAAGVAPFRLRLGAIGRFPRTGRPRVLWVGAEEPGGDGRLPELARRLEAQARRSGFPPEQRPFRPHLTLARARRPGRPGWDEAVGAAARIEWVAEELILFRSELHSSGARYTALDRYPLEEAREEP